MNLGVRHLWNITLLNLSNLQDPADMGLDPSFFQNIYPMRSATGSSIATSPS
jgi:hypothetical protein